ncbi:MAG: TonB-dependent receptor plug domain-containing protein, partial [Sphingobacterium sp.]|nr:TonB-dependent receptor plug domain-containing protein [Sphingobacterium sp.]
MNNRTVYLFSSFFLLICCWQPLSAHAVYQKKIDVKAENKPLKTILNLLEEQSNYFFLYDNTLLEKHQNININFANLSLKDALDLLSERINVDYKIVDNTVTLFPKKAKAQQEKLITGTIKLKDTDNDVPYTTNGVSIQVKGTNKGTTTNFKGEFSLQVPVSSTLVISYIGYDKQEFSVTPSTVSVQSTLKQSEGSISEVIVTAYGTKETRENQIGSAYTITAKDIEKRPSLRIDALLQGVVPGVQFSSQDQTNSSPRPRFSTRVRGESSSPGGTMSNEPLWVIDGVPLNTGGTTNSIAGVETSISPLTYINPDDIESITVLKDASATVLYGSSASNGVVIIRTKKGQGVPTVRYTFRKTLDRIASHNTFNVLNPKQYREVVNEMGLSSKIAVYEDGATNWLEAFYDTGRINQHGISVSGSNENTNYYISGSVYDQKLTATANTTKRYSLRSQINTDISSRLSLNFVFGGSYNKNDMFNIKNAYYSNLPIISLYDRDGNYAIRDYAGIALSPSLAESVQNENRQNTFQSFGQIQGTFRIIDGLEFTTRNGIDISSLQELRYSSMHNLTGMTNKGYLYKNQV